MGTEVVDCPTQLTLIFILWYLYVSLVFHDKYQSYKYEKIQQGNRQALRRRTRASPFFSVLIQDHWQIGEREEKGSRIDPGMILADSQINPAAT